MHALRLLAATDEPSSLAELAEAIDAAARRPETDWSSLLIIPGAAGPAAAVWVQPQPGNTARLWLPADSSNQSDQPGQPGRSEWGPILLRGARQWAARQGLSIVQAVIETADEAAALLLRENGFPFLVDLLYLRADTRLCADISPHSPHSPHNRQDAPIPTRHPDASIESIGQLPSSRLLSLMTRIEDGSLDCPGLHGVLSPLQAIDGFQQQGQFTPEHWYILGYKGEDAGLLLLAQHPPTHCWELIYMGIVPEWRGHGLGRLLVAEALSRVQHRGAELLLLSVDVRNQPARLLYETTGFQVYAKRSLYAWTPNGEEDQGIRLQTGQPHPSLD
ncbi:MAG: GNAT family N-acetyltransferase [Lamprobacter sp.]|uniref:GNAT family N-acetyltransferase n=1 Tax=Lamprobacter sp. TaxID=3100796 RepID=UPI002B2614C5|nr:GNAT family N-acetyltransferase [Lamprobacter sp.]MEA3639757.1 GNAT family N-acetyltransferase [Lamprobacter sp.]